MKWHPEKYWNANDARLIILQKYLESIPVDKLELIPTEKIIEICIQALSNFSLTSTESKTLKRLILEHDEAFIEPCVGTIFKHIHETGLSEITLLSLGCGNESSFEIFIDKSLRERMPNLIINWHGVDVGDYRDNTSLFNEHPFTIVNGDENIRYRSLVTDNMPVILIGRYSYHHIGIDFSEFKERCGGLDKVVLIEEPTTSDLWLIPDYRFMRIAYDVMANTVFVLGWAKEFAEETSKFKINYIQTDKLDDSIEIVEFKNVLPETALISFKP